MKTWILVFGLLLPGVCAADLLPPTQEEKRSLEEATLRASKGEYEMADQYCAGKSIGNACWRPYTPPQFGGRGTCVAGVTGRGGNGKTVWIVEADCRPRSYVRDDGLTLWNRPPRLPVHLCPPGGDLTPERAAEAQEIIDAMREAGYVTPSCRSDMAYDRGCKGKAVGDPCTMEMTLKGESTPDRFEGVCIVESESWGDSIGKPDQSGRKKTISWQTDTLACRTPTLEKTVMRPASPPGFFGKLFEE
jgi:hypothetical protein